MAPTLRRNRCLLGLLLLTAVLIGLPADGGPRPAAASTAVVQKKFADGPPPAEAQAAEAAPPGVVRKKLPAPPAAPASAGPTPAAPAAPPAVQAAEPAPAPVAVTPAAAEEAKPAETKPADTVTAAPAPPPPAPVPAPPAAPVAAAPPPAVAKPTVKTSPGPARTPFSLLLASCQDRRNAEAALADFRRTGLAPHIVQTDLGPKGVWWRTLAGAYPSLEEAMAAKRGPALAQAVPVRTPYANLVGEFESEPEAAAAAAELARKGLSPYTVRKGASVQLMVGAFQAQAAAESQRREMEALGVTARTVQR